MCSQSSSSFVQLAHFIHYKQMAYAAKSDRNSFKDTIVINQCDATRLQLMESDEVQYEGRMFDVKRKIIKENSILLVGHYDSWDDELLSVVSLLFEEGSPYEDEDQQPGYQVPFDAILNSSYCYRLPKCNTDVVCETVYLKPFYNLLTADILFRPPEVSVA
jgi:hypothetical protein